MSYPLIGFEDKSVRARDYWLAGSMFTTSWYQHYCGLMGFSQKTPKRERETSFQAFYQGMNAIAGIQDISYGTGAICIVRKHEANWSDIHDAIVRFTLAHFRPGH